MNMKRERGRFFYYVAVPRKLRIVTAFEFTLLGCVELFASLYHGGRWWARSTSQEPYDMKNIVILSFCIVFSLVVGLIEVDNHLSGKRETAIANPYQCCFLVAILIVFAISIPWVAWNTIRH